MQVDSSGWNSVYSKPPARAGYTGLQLNNGGYRIVQLGIGQIQGYTSWIGADTGGSK